MNYEVIDEVIANYMKRGRRMRNVTQREFAAEKAEMAATFE